MDSMKYNNLEKLIEKNPSLKTAVDAAVKAEQEEKALESFDALVADLMGMGIKKSDLAKRLK